MSSGKAITTVVIAAIAAAGAIYGAPAEASSDFLLAGAQSSNPFSSLVGEKRERRARRSNGRAEVERYVLASDDRTFLFENRTDEARVIFLCRDGDARLGCMLDQYGPAPEIYLLRPTRGPRGDVIYKNAAGDTLLRIASYGGATVFWPGEFRGFAASKSFGDDAPLRLSPASVADAVRRAQAATATISAATGAPIVFRINRAPAEAAEDATVLADAVMRAADGLKKVADDPTGARIIAGRISQVVFIPDSAAGVSLSETALEVRYVPNLDVSGRPSSTSVERFLEETL